MKLFGKDCGCAKRKQRLKDAGLWPGGKPRHQAKATQVHRATKRQMLADIAEAEAQVDAMQATRDLEDDTGIS